MDNEKALESIRNYKYERESGHSFGGSFFHEQEQNMKDKQFWKGAVAGAAAVILVGIGGVIGYNQMLYGEQSVLADKNHIRKIRTLEKIVDLHYLEDSDDEKLAEGLYAGLLYGLDDPYSRYYTAEDYKEENTVTEGTYMGIGILMKKNPDGGIQVVTCYEGGPAKEAGVQDNDIIQAVDGTDVTGEDISEIADRIRNSKKDSVMLTIYRENTNETVEIPVAITDVELPCVFSEMLDKETGYIRITEFKGVTFQQYQQKFEELKAEGMEKLIIDLRDNPGGLLDSVCEVLRWILPKGCVVYTEDKYGNREEEMCDGKHPLDMPLAVLVNEGSASASEIFAGAVQDYGIGTIVGTTTYGKGIVQAIYPLGDGSAVKLTVAKYFTPNGKNIHKVGIEPDVLVKKEMSKEEDNQLQEARRIISEK